MCLYDLRRLLLFECHFILLIEFIQPPHIHTHLCCVLSLLCDSAVAYQLIYVSLFMFKCMAFAMFAVYYQYNNLLTYRCIWLIWFDSIRLFIRLIKLIFLFITILIQTNICAMHMLWLTPHKNIKFVVVKRDSCISCTRVQYVVYLPNRVIEWEWLCFVTGNHFVCV